MGCVTLHVRIQPYQLAKAMQFPVFLFSRSVSVSAASGAPPARRHVLARVGPGGTAAAGVPALSLAPTARAMWTSP